LVHRDVKPANVLVSDDDHAYLSDFGAVKELASGGTTRTGSFVGTLEYSAPEQIEGGAVDARTDVYALACVLYECMAGAPPFHRPSEVAVLNAHLHAEPAKLPEAAPDLPEALERVIGKALSKSPLDRYGSCGELVAAARSAAAEPRVHRRRLAVSLAVLVLAALLGAAAAVGVHALAFGGNSVTTTVAQPPARPPFELSRLLIRSKDGRTLNDIAYALISAKQYQRALPFARKAVKRAPVGTLTRGYATFNLGFVLLELGRCGESLRLLQKALRIEPSSLRPYIRPRITQAKNCSRRGASRPAQSP
jgi:tetratricopeptide (TPR) repeat protein